MASTLLSIDDIDFSDYASRGISATLKPIDSGELARDVNGNLVDMTLDEFRKYELSVTCTDHEAPELDNVWRGKEVTVTVIPQLGVSDASDGTLTLTMMVDSWEVQRDEWQASTGWTLNLVEV